MFETTESSTTKNIRTFVRTRNGLFDGPVAIIQHDLTRVRQRHERERRRGEHTKAV